MKKQTTLQTETDNTQKSDKVALISFYILIGSVALGLIYFIALLFGI